MTNQPLVEATDVWRSYRRGAETVHALAGVSLTVHPGEIVGVVGRSGSGKTTLLNQIGCLDTPTQGNVRIAATEVTRMSERQLVRFRRDNIGFIFQLFYLIPTLTARENVELPLIFAHELRHRRQRAEEALRRVGLADGRALPSQLNGGDMQRVAIARALVREPKLLLADEPTGRLERESKEQILGLFRQLARDGLGLILVTHDLNLAQQTDRIIELRDGRVVGEEEERLIRSAA